MIATWMLYLAVVSVALGLGAWTAERAVRMYRLPARFVWFAALAGTILLPVVAWLGWLSPSSPLAVVGGGSVAFAIDWLSAPVPASVELPSGLRVDALLLAFWVGLSAVTGSGIAIAAIKLGRERAQWSRRTIDGQEVFVTPDVGPAVVGFGPTAVVIPEWLMSAVPTARRIALLHEHAHVEARDPHLLALSLLSVVLVPWNPVMWWMLARLRAAVEVDCDARVLKTGVASDVYAGLLLHVSSRRHAHPVLASAFARSPSLLGRRVKEMFPTRIRARGLRAVMYGVIAVAFIAVGCDAPSPEAGLSTPVGPTDPGQPLLVMEGDENLPDLIPERLSCPVPSYPRLLQQAGIQGQVLLRFIVDTAGGVESGSVEIIESTHRAFEAPATAMIRECLFTPAVLRGELVRAQVMMPVVFALAPLDNSVSVLLRGRATPADEPLYVVDGVILGDRQFDVDKLVNKLDISSIEVVKGAAARALYGPRASRGVVHITTVEAAERDTSELVPVKERPRSGN